MTTSLSLKAGYSDCVSSYCLATLDVFNIILGLIPFVVVFIEHVLWGEDLKTHFGGFPLVDLFVFAK